VIWKVRNDYNRRPDALQTMGINGNRTRGAERKPGAKRRAASAPRTASPARKRRLCLGSHLSVAGGVSRAVAGAIELGLESLQIFTKNASRWEQRPIPDDEVARFRELRAAWGGGPVGSHDSYLINLASPRRDLWTRSVRAFTDELERAELLGLDFLVMHPGAHLGSGLARGLRRIADGIRAAMDRVPHRSTRILLENTAGQGSTIGRTFGEIGDLLDAIDAPSRTGACIDTCHMFAAGYELRTGAGYARTMEELDAAVGARRVFCLHLNDSRGDLGSRLDRHEHIGAGRIGAAGFRRVLRDPRFSGTPKILETPKEDDMDRVNLKALEAL
jgi:deoxyribonuclease-4